MSYFYGGSSSTNFADNCLQEDGLIKTKGNSPVFQDRGESWEEVFRTEIRLSSRSGNRSRVREKKKKINAMRESKCGIRASSIFHSSFSTFFHFPSFILI